MVLAQPAAAAGPAVHGTTPRPRAVLLGACAVVVAVRLVFAAMPLRSDEGGYLVVARAWRSAGEFLYGDYYVDRPPLLLGLYRLAALTDWEPAVRVLTIPFAVGFVLAAALVGRLLAGDSGTRWATVTAAGLMLSPGIGADQADGEVFAAPLVMAGIACALVAWNARSSRTRMAAALLAGVFAGAAPTVKQSFLDALVFLALLVLAALLLGRDRRRSLETAGAAVVGALLPHVLVVAWMSGRGLDASSMWGQIAVVRASALEVIWSQPAGPVVTRGVALLLLAVASGLAVIVVVWARSLGEPHALRQPLSWAVAGTLGYGSVAVALGGSYWPHYLLQLAPVAVVVVARAAAGAAVAARRCAVWVVTSAAVGVIVIVVAYAAVPWTWFQVRTGEWLAASAEPGDTGFVAYGNPSILLYADLDSPYPHLWSLPMRTLDPGLERLERTLRGPEAPAWIVGVNGLNSWRIDEEGGLRAAIDERYRGVGAVCGHPVWLRDDLDRTLAPPPRC